MFYVCVLLSDEGEDQGAERTPRPQQGPVRSPASQGPLRAAATGAAD